MKSICGRVVWPVVLCMMSSSIARSCPAHAADVQDALTVVEYYGIASGNDSPFWARPGSAISQNVHNPSAGELNRWQIGKSRLPATERIAAAKTWASFSPEWLKAFARLEESVVRAYYAELAETEQARFAKVRANRSDDYFTERTRTALEWVVMQGRLEPQQQIEQLNVEIGKSETMLRGEIRRRYRAEVQE